MPNLKSVHIKINADWGRVTILDSNSRFGVAKPGYTSRVSVWGQAPVMHKCSFSSQSIEVFKEKSNSDLVSIVTYVESGNKTIQILTAHGSNGTVKVTSDSDEVINLEDSGGQNEMVHYLTL